MGRIAENWERVVQAVPCPVCGVLRGEQCLTAYGEPFRKSKGHQQRRDRLRREEGRQQGSVEVSGCDGSEKP